MGRPRKIVDLATGKIGKEKIAARKEQEEKLKLNREQLKAPEWLKEDAALEFERVVTEAGKIDLLDNLDLGVLAIHANAWSCYVDISIQIQEVGFLAERNTQHDNYHVVQPLINAQEKYVKQIMQCSAKLGLATTDRLKLVVPVKEEKEINKYLKYAR